MSIETKEDLLATIHEHRQQLRRRGVRRCGLFGSFVHGRPTDDSDINILVEFEPGQKTFDNFMGLAEYLEELFGRQVHLVTTESLSPYIGPHILSEVEYASLGT